jgi:hypothetical protein
MIIIIISRRVGMRSALKHLIVAGMEIHKLTPLNISVLLCGKDSSILNSLQLAIFTESREYCITTDQRLY